MGILYICSFCLFFYITFTILQATRLESVFKSGRIWQIRVAYILISFVISYLITQGIYDITQIIRENIVQ